MAGLTENFGFTWLTGGDDPSTNNYAFYNLNIVRIDQLLKAGRDHHHTGAAASLADPDQPPSLVLDTSSGSIPAGVTVRYKYTYVDEFGAETAGSPEGTIATPPPISPPSAPVLTTATTGGTLVGGNYGYGLTAYIAPSNTNETTLGSRALINVPFTTATNTVTLTLPALPTGADGFNVYRRGPGEALYSCIAHIDMSGPTPPTTFVDDGDATPDCDRQPPTTNQTNSTNSVLVSLPGATPTVPLGATWKLYRTYVADDYSSSLLHHIIEETFVGSGIIDPTYLDEGQTTTAGSPPEESLVLAQPSKVLLTDLAEVAGILPVGANIVPHQATFVYGGALEVATGTVVWRCPFDYAQIQSCSATLGRDSTPASTDVIVDVNLYSPSAATPSWGTIYTTQANRPRVEVGEFIGTPTVPNIIDLVEGDLLTVDIDQVGGGATPTDYDLTVTIYMYIRSGDQDTSVVIP